MFEYTKEKIRQNLWDLNHYIHYSPSLGERRVLVVQEEGLGNAVLTTPLIKALASLTPAWSIDVLVDRRKGSDLVFGNWPIVRKIFDRDEFSALNNLFHYHTVLECHPRHELPCNLKYKVRKRIAIHIKPGLDYHWNFNKHESEYLLDMVRQMGYMGPKPGIRKLVGDANYSFDFSDNMVAIGIGYFKGDRSDGRNWSDRHWGNLNYLLLCQQLQKNDFRPILVGDQKDFDANGAWLAERGIESICGKLSLAQVFNFLSRCKAFIGNDTGLMHVAASVDIPTLGIFITTSSIKSFPLGSRSVALGGNQGPKRYEIAVKDVLSAFYDALQGR